MVSVNMLGLDSPQSLALFTQTWSLPKVSRMSHARCGVTLLTG